MAEKVQVSTPAGSAGIFRFYDTEGKGIKIKPAFIIALTAIFVLGILILKFAFGRRV
ncbi:Sec61beta family protein [uncultured archaeon]|nr:Sec61beta family protein [uncultured archaeon]